MSRSLIKSGGRAKNTDSSPFNPMTKQDRLYPHFMTDAWQRDHASFASKIRGFSVFSICDCSFTDGVICNFGH